MSQNILSRAILRESLQFAAKGLPIALLVSLVLAYVLLMVPGLDAFSRGVALAIALPVLLVMPLLCWVAVERARLAEARKALNRASARDPVTGFVRGPVLAGFVDRRREPSSPERSGGAFLLVDASALGAINRAFGMEWHDDALRHVSTAIAGAVRSTDLVGCTGTDSFGVFLAGASEAEALDVGERIRVSVEDSYFAPEGVRHMIEVKIAGVTFADHLSFNELYVQATLALDQPDAHTNTAVIKAAVATMGV